MRGTVTTDSGLPFSDVCVVVGPGSSCSFVTALDGKFQLNLTKSATVSWTVLFSVNGAVLAVPQYAGPFEVDVLEVGPIALPRVIQ